MILEHKEDIILGALLYIREPALGEVPMIGRGADLD